MVLKTVDLEDAGHIGLFVVATDEFPGRLVAGFPGKITIIEQGG